MRKDSIILIVLGIIGLLPLIYPLYLVDGKYPIYGFTYYQSGTPVYIRVLDSIRLAYNPLLFVSITVMILGLVDLIGLVNVPLDVRIVSSVAYSMSSISFTGVLTLVKTGVIRMVSNVDIYTIVMNIHVTKTFITNLYLYKDIPVLFIVSLLLSSYYVVELVYHSITIGEGELEEIE